MGLRPQDVLDKNRFCDESVVCGMLTELALYFLIYTESSSMRHSPELLWFLYWCFNHRCGGPAQRIPYSQQSVPPDHSVRDASLNAQHIVRGIRVVPLRFLPHPVGIPNPLPARLFARAALCAVPPSLFSYVMQDLWNRDPPENFPNIREVRIGLRNKYQQVIRELQSVLGIYPDRIRPEDCGRLGPIMTRLKVGCMKPL